MSEHFAAITIEETRAAGGAVLDRVSADGAAIVPLASAWSATPAQLRESAAASPFAFAARLLGVEPLLVERQPIRPIASGRSFASTNVDTPLHTDSQMFLGAPAAIQILVCVEPAKTGGESVFVDAARLLARLERDDPALASALFEIDRVQRFYFGDVVGPTVGLRSGHLTWTCAPIGAEPARSDDRVGAALAHAVASEPPKVYALRAGEALVASNHRMLHGRRAFEGSRELVRLLVWLERPLAADARHRGRARVVEREPDETSIARLRAVLAILRGVPPAKVAAEARITEATLYGLREAFMRGGLDALGR